MSTALHEAVEHLARLLEEENAALEAMDFARAGSLLATKHAAADALAAAWRAAPPDQEQVPALSELGALAETNRRLLNRALRVQRRVLDLVARAARGSMPDGRYSAAGRPAARQTAPRTLATRL